MRKVARWNYANTQVETWFERDRMHVAIYDNLGNLIFELWDSAVSEFVNDGFKKSNQDWKTALLSYINTHNLKGKQRA